MEKVPETKEYKRCSLDNSYFITFSEREWFYGSTSICSFG